MGRLLLRMQQPGRPSASNGNSRTPRGDSRPRRQPQLRRLLQRIFFEAQVAQQRVIEDLQLDTAALELTLPAELKALREQALAAPFDEAEGRPQMGQYVEVLEIGRAHV